MSKEGYRTVKYDDVFDDTRHTCIYLMVNDSLRWYCDKYHKHLGMGAQSGLAAIAFCSFYERDGNCVIDPDRAEAVHIRAQREAEFNEKTRQEEKAKKEKIEKENATLKLIAGLTEKIRLSPKDDELYVSRGLFYTYKEDFKSAIDDFNDALRLNPKNAKAYECRGMVYSQKKEYGKAIEDFTKAIRLNPKSKNAYKMRGAAYGVYWERNKSIADYKYALKLDRNDKSTAIALENAKKLKRISIEEKIRQAFWITFGIVLGGGIAGGLLFGVLSPEFSNNHPILHIISIILMILTTGALGLLGVTWVVNKCGAFDGFWGCVGCLGVCILGGIAVLAVVAIFVNLIHEGFAYIPIGVGTIAGAVTGYFIVRDRI